MTRVNMRKFTNTYELLKSLVCFEVCINVISKMIVLLNYVVKCLKFKLKSVVNSNFM